MDVDATIRAMASEGGQQLGPSRINEDGSVTVILRDPFGALFSCCGRSPSGPAADPVSSAEVAPAEAQPVGWHVHLSRGRAAASALYARLFGWDVRDEVEATPPFGRCTPFAIDAASPSVGVMADAGDDRRVHTQWLHFFLVNDLEGALARVRASGGLVVMTAPGPGGVFAPCDDPQGAAFGLMQQP
jgi:predicted enzyme related to lactoylglutathione lyase